MTEIERAYAMVHMQRANAILGGYGGYGAMGGMAVSGPPAAFSESDKQAFLLELERAKAWVVGESTLGPRVVAMRGTS